MVRVVAHGGLGVHRRGGAPTRTTLRRALRLGVDTVEVDVCATADGAVVLHHDARTPLGTPMSDVALRQLRRFDPEVLTLDEAMEELASIRVVLDLKTPQTVAPLTSWLHDNVGHHDVVVCTERVDALRAIVRDAPRTRIWQTFPNVGERKHERVTMVLAALLAHRGRDAVRVAGDIAGVIPQLSSGREGAWSRLAGVPWRRLLPDLLETVRYDLSACGIAVHHALVTPDLCIAAHALDLSVTAWTVNETCVARRVASCGVDMITTDDVGAVRRALPARPQLLLPPRPRLSVAY